MPQQPEDASVQVVGGHETPEHHRIVDLTDQRSPPADAVGNQSDVHEAPSPRAHRLLPRRNSRAGRAVIRTASLLERLDPSPTALAITLRGLRTPSALVTCVYRQRNASVVRALTGSPQVLGSAQVRWSAWALDAEAADLAVTSAGSGPGARMDLHQRMLAAGKPADDEWWVITDDDVQLPAGGIPLLLRVAAAAGLDVSGPSHAYTSFWSHRITIRRPLSIARLTHFVEIGPVVVLSPRARAELLPFPSAAVAGWGMETYWSSLRRPNLRCGLIDAVAVRHLTPMGGAYDSHLAYLRGEEFAAELGVDDFQADQRAMMTTVATWRPGWTRPPWSDASRR